MSERITRSQAKANEKNKSETEFWHGIGLNERSLLTPPRSDGAESSDEHQNRSPEDTIDPTVADNEPIDSNSESGEEELDLTIVAAIQEDFNMVSTAANTSGTVTLTTNTATVSAASTQAKNLALKNAIQGMPIFDGENLSLNDFFEYIDEVKLVSGETPESDLVNIIRYKVTGQARKALHGRTFSTIDELKAHLKDLYFSGQSVFQLTGILGNIYQKPSESVVSYANRVRELGSRILESYQLEKTPSTPEYNQYQTELEINLAKCFRKGLKLELEQRVKAQETLGLTVKEATQIERDLHAIKALREQFASQSISERRRVLFTETDEGDFALERYKGSQASNDNGIGHMLHMDGPIKCGICMQKTHETKFCPLTLCRRCPIQNPHPIYECPENDREHYSARGHQIDRPSSKEQVNKRPHYAHSSESEDREARRTGRYKGCNEQDLECQLCGKTNHTAPNCFKYFPPKQQRKGNFKERLSQSCGVCGKIGHDTKSCYQIPPCSYCGLTNHDESRCFKKMRDERLAGNESEPSAKGAPKENNLKSPDQGRLERRVNYLTLD